MQKALFVLTLLIYWLTISSISMLLMFGLLLFVVPKNEKINRVLSHEKMDYLGKISFGVYSIHWPLFCSLSTLLIISLWQSLGIFAIFLAILLSIALTIFLSILYYKFI